jgi:hypothetical protein
MRPSLLLHPLPLAAIALTAVNDHLLKGNGALPDWLTGKLSDFAGLFFFPIALVAAFEAVARGRWSRMQAVLPALAAALTGALFVLCKLSPATCARLPVAVTADASDLLALPTLPLACCWIARRQRRPPVAAAAWARLAALGAAALTSAATSPLMGPNYFRPLPIWSVVAPASRPLACAAAELWVSRSGTEGVGVTLALRAREQDCMLRIDRIAFVLPEAGVSATAQGFPRELALVAGASDHHLYLPFAFDNATAWRRQQLRATVELQAADTAGAPPVRFDLIQRQPPAPEWGTYSNHFHRVWGVPAELLVTETSPEGVTFLVRLGPPTATSTVRLGALQLSRGKTSIATAARAVTVELAAGEQVDVPFFLPVDAARRASLEGDVMAATVRDVTATLEFLHGDSDPEIANWQVEVTRERKAP